MNKNTRIFVAGHRGMVGSAIVRRLQAAGYLGVLTASCEQLNLLDQPAVHAFLVDHRPEHCGDCRQRPVPCRLPVREPPDRGQPHPRSPSRRRAATALPRFKLHLSARLPAPGPGGRLADRPARRRVPHDPRAARRVLQSECCRTDRLLDGTRERSAIQTTLGGKDTRSGGVAGVARAIDRQLKTPPLMARKTDCDAALDRQWWITWKPICGRPRRLDTLRCTLDA